MQFEQPLHLSYKFIRYDMQAQIKIDNPCHENWNDMSPDHNGRHCARCCKTVVDFTSWETEDIFLYLKNNKNTCGRLLESQMVLDHSKETTLHNILASSLTYWKKIAAIIVICFGLTGAAFAQRETTKTNKSTNHTTKSTQSTLMGDTVLPQKYCEPYPEGADSVKKPNPEAILLGEPAIEPPPQKRLTGKVRVDTTSSKTPKR